MKRMNLRLWLTSSQRRMLELFGYMVLLIAGCCAGTVCILKDPDMPLCRFCLAYGIPDISPDSAPMLSSLRWCGSVWLLSLCLGFCGIGQPFLCILLGIHGFSTGCLLTELSQSLTSRRLPLYIFAACYAIAVSFILLLGIREAVRLSCTSIKAYLRETDSGEMRRRLRLYGVRFTVLLIMIFAASGVYALCFRFL